MTLAPHSSAFYCPNNLSVSLGLLLAVQRAGESAHTWALEFRSGCRLRLLQRLMSRRDQKFTDVVTSVLPLGEDGQGSHSGCLLGLFRPTTFMYRWLNIFLMKIFPINS